MDKQRDKAMKGLEFALDYLTELKDDGQEIIEEFATCNIGQLRRALGAYSDTDTLHVTFEGKTYAITSVGIKHGHLMINFGRA